MHALTKKSHRFLGLLLLVMSVLRYIFFVVLDLPKSSQLFFITSVMLILHGLNVVVMKILSSFFFAFGTVGFSLKRSFLFIFHAFCHVLVEGTFCSGSDFSSFFSAFQSPISLCRSS